MPHCIVLPVCKWFATKSCTKSMGLRMILFLVWARLDLVWDRLARTTGTSTNAGRPVSIGGAFFWFTFALKISCQADDAVPRNSVRN